jgi:cytochrome c biogenesis protein CcdA
LDPGASRAASGGRSRRRFLAIAGILTATLFAASGIAFLSLGARTEVTLAAGATVYFNEACGDCATYLEGELLPALARAGIVPVAVKDYINDRSYRAELTSLNDALGIPFELQSHLATFVRDDGILTFEGHVPSALVEEAIGLDVAARPTNLLVYQDAMEGASTYRAWAFAGPAPTYPITTSLGVYVAWYEANGPAAGTLPPAVLLPLVVTTGLLDGLNPCAFAVLVFFMAFLHAVRVPRAEMLRMGSAYAYAVFLVYFLIGLGLLGAITVSEDPHLIARIAAIAVIALGTLGLLHARFPGIPGLDRIASGSWPRVKERILAGSLPSATAAGLLVGLCTFPCSGGVYVAILGLLGAQTSFVEGLGYLYLYNAMYILPLLAVLATVSSRTVALAAARWERLHAGRVKIAIALGMVVMGALFLVLSV